MPALNRAKRNYDGFFYFECCYLVAFLLCFACAAKKIDLNLKITTSYRCVLTIFTRVEWRHCSSFIFRLCLCVGLSVYTVCLYCLVCLYAMSICYMSICLFVCVFVCLSICLFVCLSVYLFLFVCLSVCLFVCFSVCLFIAMSVCYAFIYTYHHISVFYYYS